MLFNIRDALLSAAFPQICHICRGLVRRHEDGVACSGCWEATRVFTPEDALCAKCGNVLAVIRPSSPNCSECSGHLYDLAFAVGVYEAALSAVILNLKEHPTIPGRLNRIVEQTFSSIERRDVDVVIPVPLSSRRLVERGFNQAKVIGKLVSRILEQPIDDVSLVRTAHTPVHRAGMDRKAREATVTNVFAVKRPKLIEGRRVLLVDDVFTSGSTASNCAKVLKKNGATSVEVFTLARAVLSGRGPSATADQ